MKATRKKSKKQVKIEAIGITNDVLTGRGGMALFVRYLNVIGILPCLVSPFLPLRIRKRGIKIIELFKQIICCLVEGGSRHLTCFNTLRKDPGYAAAIETSPEDMATSHAIKRFVGKVSYFRIFSLRRILQKMFIHRLNQLKPSVILLGNDTMVMNNDDAHCREGVKRFAAAFRLVSACKTKNEYIQMHRCVRIVGFKPDQRSVNAMSPGRIPHLSTSD